MWWLIAAWIALILMVAIAAPLSFWLEYHRWDEPRRRRAGYRDAVLAAAALLWERLSFRAWKLWMVTR